MQNSSEPGGTVPQTLAVDAYPTAPVSSSSVRPHLNTSRVPGVTRNSGWQAVHAELALSRIRPAQ